MSADDAARQEALRRYRRQTMHVGTAQDREKAAFEAGAQWQRERPVSDAERSAVRGAIGNVLCNVSNFPEPAQSRLLGEYLAPLINKVTQAVLAAKGASNG